MTRMSGALPRQTGFTLIEMVVVISVIGILAALLVPYVATRIDEARVTRAQSDTQNIGQAISNMYGDLGRYPMFSTASTQMPDTAANVVTLRGPGNIPTETATTAWTSSAPTDTDCSGSCVWDTLADQLLTNSPGYTTSASLAAPFQWKGPYVDPQADPWGNAYLVNIIHCKVSSKYGCFVLSAGPNGKVETAFDILETTSISAGGDDILYRIR